MYNFRKVKINDKVYILVVNVNSDQIIIDKLKSGPLNDLINEGDMDMLESVLWHQYDTLMVEDNITIETI
jgi:hypothetical protein